MYKENITLWAFIVTCTVDIVPLPCTKYHIASPQSITLHHYSQYYIIAYPFIQAYIK